MGSFNGIPGVDPAYVPENSGQMFNGYAAGGDPPTNQPSIVGEYGPEVFMPKTAGTVHTNDQLMSALKGGSSQGDVHVHINNSPVPIDDSHIVRDGNNVHVNFPQQVANSTHSQSVRRAILQNHGVAQAGNIRG
jgi:hypothetical protein